MVFRWASMDLAKSADGHWWFWWVATGAVDMPQTRCSMASSCMFYKPRNPTYPHLPFNIYRHMRDFYESICKSFKAPLFDDKLLRVARLRILVLRFLCQLQSIRQPLESLGARPLQSPRPRLGNENWMMNQWESMVKVTNCGHNVSESIQSFTWSWKIFKKRRTNFFRNKFSFNSHDLVL